MFKVWPDECVSGVNKVATLNCIPTIFLNIVSAILAFSGTIALIMFIMGGFKLMNSAGDPKKIDSAKNNFTFGIIGLMLVLFSFVIINIISQATGVACIRKFGFGC